MISLCISSLFAENTKKIVDLKVESENLDKTESSWLVSAISDKIEENFSTYTDFLIVSEENLEEVFKLQKRAESIAFDQNDSIEFGKIKNPDYQLLVTVRKNNEDYALSLKLTDISTAAVKVSLNSQKPNVQTLYSSEGCAIDELTLKLCEKLDLSLSNTEKNILRYGKTGISYNDNIKIYTDDVNIYNTKIININDKINKSTDENKIKKLEQELENAEKKLRIAENALENEQAALTAKRKQNNEEAEQAKKENFAREQEKKQLNEEIKKLEQELKNADEKLKIAEQDRTEKLASEQEKKHLDEEIKKLEQELKNADEKLKIAEQELNNKKDLEEKRRQKEEYNRKLRESEQEKKDNFAHERENPMHTYYSNIKYFAESSKPLEISSLTEGTFEENCTYALFGVWPQNRKSPDVDIDTTKKEKINGWFCYEGSDGNYYVKGNEDSSLSDTEESYFQLMPIKWRIASDDFGGGTLLIAEDILDTCSFYESDQKRGKYYPNDYKKSSIRAYLNSIDGTDYGVENYKYNGFLNRAFSDKAFSCMKNVNVDYNIHSGFLDTINKIDKLNIFPTNLL